MKVQDDRPLQRSSGASKLVWAGIGMAGVAFLSVQWMEQAVQEDSPSMRWLGELSLTLVCACALCLFIALAKFIQSWKELAKGRSPRRLVRLDEQYVAEYSRGDRIVALAIAVFFGSLTIYFLLHAARLRSIALAAVFCGFGLWRIAEATGTRVKFTHEGIAARISWWRKLSEPWSNVERISSQRSSLKIEFAGGGVLKLHPGLGNADTVIAYLRACRPPSVPFE
jgi:hypothetical protein